MTDDLATSPAVSAFVQAAETFQTLVEDKRRFATRDDLVLLTKVIAELYAAGVVLEPVEPTDSKAEPTVTVPADVSVGPDDGYWEVFDPYEESNLVMGSLTDDVRDIYGDVVPGLMLYRRGEVENAVWTWAFLRQNHWGDHAVDALRALQRLIRRVE